MKMKHLTAIVTAALLAMLVAAPASAELFPRVPRDWQTTYGGDSAGGSEIAPGGWQPGDGPGEPLNTTAQIGDEERAVLMGTVLSSSAGTAPEQSIPDGRFTALMYNLELLAIRPTGPTDPDEFTLYYGDSERNPHPNKGTGEGGRFEIWADDTIDTFEDSQTKLINNDGDGLAPVGWQEGGHSTGADGYETVNRTDAGGADESFSGRGAGLWLSGTFAELGTIPGTSTRYVKSETLDLTGGEASSLDQMNLVPKTGFAFDEGYLDTSPGSNFATANVFLPPDASYSDPADSGNWATEFNDPFTFSIASDISTINIGGQTFTVDGGSTHEIQLQGASSLYAPEPGMASLLGIGLLGLLLSGRGRRERD